MHLVQILLVIIGVLVYVTHQQIPQQYPQGNTYEKNRETKLTEKNENTKSDKKSLFIANVPKAYKNNSNQTATLLKKTDGEALNDIPNHTINANNGNLKVNQTLKEETDELQSGAITRGILVFVAFSFLFILYVGIKTCRRKAQDKRRTVVRKYGVRARRSDVEMEPLPLSDDDEDETVFDLTASRGIQG